MTVALPLECGVVLRALETAAREGRSAEAEEVAAAVCTALGGAAERVVAAGLVGHAAGSDLKALHRDSLQCHARELVAVGVKASLVVAEDGAVLQTGPPLQAVERLVLPATGAGV